MSAVVPPDLLALIPEPYRGASRVGNSAEEVARWRAERRKHFPTDAVVSLKRAREEAREEAGALPGAALPMGAMRRRALPAASAAPVTGAAAVAPAPAEDVNAGPDEEPASLAARAAAAAAAASVAAAPPLPPLPAPAADGAGVDGRLGVAPAAPSGAAGGGRTGAAPCAAFRARGRCRYGAQCRYSHGATGGGGGGPPAPGSIPAACRWYLLGVCTAGKRCPYQHAAGGGGGGAGTASQTPAAAAGDTSGLLRRLLARDVQRETSMLLQAIRFLVERGPGSLASKG
jgi:hypothetical protein